eukprot:9493036-Pyramimonas_sp.AAC.1
MVGREEGERGSRGGRGGRGDLFPTRHNSIFSFGIAGIQGGPQNPHAYKSSSALVPQNIRSHIL